MRSSAPTASARCTLCTRSNSAAISPSFSEWIYFEKIIPLGAQPHLFWTISLGYRLRQFLQAGIFASARLDLACKHNRRGGSTTNHRRVGSFQRCNFQLFIQCPREDNVRAAVI